jgi:hypothetical protein
MRYARARTAHPLGVDSVYAETIKQQYFRCRKLPTFAWIELPEYFVFSTSRRISKGLKSNRKQIKQKHINWLLPFK